MFMLVYKLWSKTKKPIGILGGPKEGKKRHDDVLISR